MDINEFFVYDKGDTCGGGGVDGVWGVEDFHALAEEVIQLGEVVVAQVSFL